ncbi:MAG: hypothetical protein CVT62_08525 [Actinobacteria bacterium HGW-Actinobacteria-2]|nr:MAG: hypothetical protein CVT62_08525 [Actinobacteria bacterium HGW-Actinobacteria-2]
MCGAATRREPGVGPCLLGDVAYVINVVAKGIQVVLKSREVALKSRQVALEFPDAGKAALQSGQ